MGEYKGKRTQSPRKGRAAVLPERRSLLGAGMMSGTSADGIDVAIIRISPVARGHRVTLLGFRTHPYPPGFRRLLLRNSDPKTANLDQISTLNILTAELFANAVLELSASLGLPTSRLDFIGSHGQTICHLPGKIRLFGHQIRSTLQIGHPSVIAKRTGVMTVGDFRVGDIA